MTELMGKLFVKLDQAMMGAIRMCINIYYKDFSIYRSESLVDYYEVKNENLLEISYGSNVLNVPLYSVKIDDDIEQEYFEIENEDLEICLWFV